MIKYLVRIYFDGGRMDFTYDAPEATAAKVLTHYEVGPV